MRMRKHRIRMPGAFGKTSEQYQAAMDRYWRRFEMDTGGPQSSPRDWKEKRFAAKIGQTTDYRVQHLYDQRDFLNQNDPRCRIDPLRVDHMWPLCQGGPDTYENMRLLQRSKDRDKKRTRADIEWIILVEAVNRGDFKPWTLPDTFEDPT